MALGKKQNKIYYYKNNFEKLAVNDPIVAQMIYVKKLAKYSTKFLRDNQNWIQ